MILASLSHGFESVHLVDEKSGRQATFLDFDVSNPDSTKKGAAADATLLAKLDARGELAGPGNRRFIRRGRIGWNGNCKITIHRRKQ
jgi:hypothetical protein